MKPKSESLSNKKVSFYVYIHAQMHIESCILIMISGMAYVSLHRVDNFDSSISCVCVFVLFRFMVTGIVMYILCAPKTVAHTPRPKN